MFKKGILFTIYLLLISLATTANGYQYIYPNPNAECVAVESTIIVRLDGLFLNNVTNLENFITVAGSQNGNVVGTTTVASDERTIIFQPQSVLAFDETFTVHINPSNVLQSIAPFSFQFKTLGQTDIKPDIATDDKKDFSNSDQNFLYKPMNGARIMPNGVSVPGDFPHIKVATNQQTADGYIFINNWRNAGPYNIIFANDGSPVWYQRQADGDRRRDFKVQDNGTISMLTRQNTRFLGYDENFNLIDEYTAAGGYSTDEHECQVLENGHYLLIGKRNVQVDMSAIVHGGSTKAVIRETTVQEFTPDHELILNWPALEYLGDGLPYLELGDPTEGFIDFPHMNAIDVDKDDGNLLVSSRHLSEVTKINRQTGEIIWRLGGVHSDFEFVNDPLQGFRNQHDIRSLGNNRYTVFDNGNLHSTNESRAVEYELDVNNKTATLVWEFRGPKDRNFYTHYMGNCQRMPNGNSFINWVTAGNPKAMEVTPDGEVMYEMNFADGYDTYRTFRFPWDGVVAQPSLYVEQDNNNLVLIFNKFGDKDVDYFNIYADVLPGPTVVVDTSRTTLKKLAGLTNEQRYYFRVTAVNTDGV